MVATKEKTISLNTLNFCLKHFIIAFFVAVTLAFFMHENWINYLSVYHSVLEITCIFIALSIFISVWFTYETSIKSNYILGFGFLLVAIFDIFHTYYHFRINLSFDNYFNLSTPYWILGRLTEALVLLFTLKHTKAFSGKWPNLAATLLIGFGTVYFLYTNNDYLPILVTESGVTPIKVILEYAIILIYFYDLFILKDKINERGMITYKYIFIALLMSISTEFCFTIYSSVNNISWTVGHLLKITSYFYLFRGVFISAVIYPHNELDRKNKKLEAVNAELNSMGATMKAILDTIPIAIQKYDSHGKLKYVNKKFTELMECDEESLIGTTIEDSINKFTATAYDSKNPDARRDRYSDKQEITAITSRTGKPIRLSLTSHDLRGGKLMLIHETKKEQELENLNIQTETILASVNNGVFMINNEKKIVLCNKAFEDLFEVQKEEILGMDVDAFNEATDFELKDLAGKVLINELDKNEYETKFTSFKGNKKEIMLYVGTIKNVDGEVIGAINISRDITEQKKEQQRILQQEKLALLGQMGAGIVHETRNFLTTIKGRCQLIDMISQDENIKRHAAKINSDVEEVNRIISEFLFLSKPRETELLEISMHDVFASIKSMIEASSLVKGVNIDFLLSEEERYVLCDESQLKQVILNICKNAIDAMSGREKAKLIVETGYDDINNDMYISITDNGKGIPEEELEKIGTPFFTTKSNGTGLGLSVCFKIVKDHGGRIEVSSKVGEGTTFKIILPCIDEEEYEEEAI